VNILSELTELLDGLSIPVETGVFSDIAPDKYVVITPLAETYHLFANDRPGYETQEARLSLYTKSNYLEPKSGILKALLASDFTITLRQYIGHEDDTGYHHYAVDTAKVYPTEED
jgi:hypothetical protein